MENMEFKGTKGKWEIIGEPFIDDTLPEGSGPYSGTWYVRSGKTTIVGVPAYSFWGLTYEEGKANAQLISKAPEMLEMLDKVLDVIAPEFPDDDQYNLIVSIKQLIKEATTIE